MKPTVAVVGASRDPAKYGNKAVRAYLNKGYEVFPVNPKYDTIEGRKCYPSVQAIPGPLDRVTVYLPPAATLTTLGDIAAKNPRELFLNPGSENPDVLEKARALGLSATVACSLIDIGVSPSDV